MRMSLRFNRVLNLCLNAHIDGFATNRRKIVARIECFTSSLSIKLAQHICEAMTNENGICSHDTLKRNWLFCHLDATTPHQKVCTHQMAEKVVQPNQLRCCFQTIKWLYVLSRHCIWIFLYGNSRDSGNKSHRNSYEILLDIGIIGIPIVLINCTMKITSCIQANGFGPIQQTSRDVWTLFPLHEYAISSEHNSLPLCLSMCCCVCEMFR